MKQPQNRGFIPLPRAFFASPVWLRVRRFSPAEAWIDLLRRARFDRDDVAFTTRSGRTVTYGQGELCVPLRTLAADWRWSESAVRYHLQAFAALGLLEVRPAGQGAAGVLRILPGCGGTGGGGTLAAEVQGDGSIASPAGGKSAAPPAPCAAVCAADCAGNDASDGLEENALRPTPCAAVCATDCAAVCDIKKKEEKESKKKEEGESLPHKGEGTGDVAPRRAARRRRVWTAPTEGEVARYCREAGLEAVDAARFTDYYAMKGWLVGRSPMKDWHAAARSWNRRELDYRRERGLPASPSSPSSPSPDFISPKIPAAPAAVDGTAHAVDFQKTNLYPTNLSSHGTFHRTDTKGAANLEALDYYRSRCDRRDALMGGEEQLF